MSNTNTLLSRNIPLFSKPYSALPTALPAPSKKGFPFYMHDCKTVNMKKFLIITAALVTLSACTPVRHVNGVFLTHDDVARLTPGVSTRMDVLQALGTPTSEALFDNDTWYYIGLKTQKDAFFDPKVTDRSVYEVKFDEAGVMTSLQQKEGEAVDVPLARRTTPTSGHSMTFAQQLLGNLGKFNTPNKGTPGEI